MFIKIRTGSCYIYATNLYKLYTLDSRVPSYFCHATTLHCMGSKFFLLTIEKPAQKETGTIQINIETEVRFKVKHPGYIAFVLGSTLPQGSGPQGRQRSLLLHIAADDSFLFGAKSEH